MALCQRKKTHTHVDEQTNNSSMPWLASLQELSLRSPPADYCVDSDAVPGSTDNIGLQTAIGMLLLLLLFLCSFPSWREKMKNEMESGERVSQRGTWQSNMCREHGNGRVVD